MLGSIGEAAAADDGLAAAGGEGMVVAVPLGDAIFNSFAFVKGVR